VDKKALVNQLQHIGLKRDDVVMVHSSFKSLGIQDPELIIGALLETLGEHGTLLMPSLSYLQDPPARHDTNLTPSCVGFLVEYFRCRAGTLRSVHPTHSVCGMGDQVHEWLGDHIEDNTPCGPHSPFSKLLHRRGKILMIGCGLKPNTIMHAIEEMALPPYLLGAPRVYTITDSQGKTFDKEYIPHNFTGVVQRYDRVEGILSGETLSAGILGNAKVFLIQADTLCQAALNRLQVDPYYFVDLLYSRWLSPSTRLIRGGQPESELSKPA
jgi:aminoglycoside 3-N-acetyltransferase